MANIAIAYDNKADAGTFTGGSWDTGLSLDNLKTYDPKHLARSDDEHEESTTFVVDLGYDAQIDIVSFVNHNLTDAAEVRIRIGPNSDGSDALIDVTIGVADFGTDVPAAGKVLFHMVDESVYAQYILVEISDESNPAGYVQFGRFIAGPVFSPAINVSYGANIAIIDESRISKAVSGAQFADLVPKRRRLSGVFDLLTNAEAFGQVYDLQKKVGLSVPLLAILDPELTGDTLQRTAIYGVLTEIQPIEIAHSVEGGDLFFWRFTLDERN